MKTFARTALFAAATLASAVASAQINPLPEAIVDDISIVKSVHYPF
jgi:hypothetical protein